MGRSSATTAISDVLFDDHGYRDLLLPLVVGAGCSARQLVAKSSDRCRYPGIVPVPELRAITLEGGYPVLGGVDGYVAAQSGTHRCTWACAAQPGGKSACNQRHILRC